MANMEKNRKIKNWELKKEFMIIHQNTWLIKKHFDKDLHKDIR